MTTRLYALAALLLVFPGCAARSPAQDIRYAELNVPVRGHSWNYYYSAPAPTDKSLPVVIVLHGAGGGGGSYLARAGWGEKAVKEGFLAIAPSALPLKPGEQADFATNPRLWNTGEIASDTARSKIEDWPFFDALIDDVGRRWHIDTKRIYVVGHSNGGSMAFAVARRWPARWAAVATVGAPPPAQPVQTQTVPDRPVPTLSLLGKDDKVVPFDGGEGKTPWGTRKFEPMRPALDRYATGMGIKDPDKIKWKETAGGGRELDYSDSFKVCIIPKQGHVWPGWTGTVPDNFGPNRKDYPVDDVIWDFLKTNSLPE